MMHRELLLGVGLLSLVAVPAQADLIMTEVVDGTLPGGQPKWVELLNTSPGTTLDLSNYSFGNFNGGSLTLGGGAAAVLTGMLAPGEVFVIAYEADNGPGTSEFFGVYGFDPDFFMGGAFVNGDDVLALFLGAATGDGSDATLRDVYGVLGTDGTGEAWEYTDGYARRCNITANFGAFVESDWTFSGPDALEAGCSGDDVCEAQNLLALTTPGLDADCGGACIGTSYCFGDGSGTACPCGNETALGGGCRNNNGVGAVLCAQGSASLSAADFRFYAYRLAPGATALLFQGDERTNAGAGASFGNGLRCAGENAVRMQVLTFSGDSVTSTIDVALVGGVVAGDTKRYQFWNRDIGSGGGCGAGFNTTNAVEITWRP